MSLVIPPKLQQQALCCRRSIIPQSYANPRCERYICLSQLSALLHHHRAMRVRKAIQIWTPRVHDVSCPPSKSSPYGVMFQNRTMSTPCSRTDTNSNTIIYLSLHAFSLPNHCLPISRVITRNGFSAPSWHLQPFLQNSSTKGDFCSNLTKAGTCPKLGVMRDK